MKAGDIVYVVRTNNAARSCVTPESLISKEVIEKVGLKYFTLKDWPQTKFDIKTMRQVTKYSADYIVYLDRQQILDEMETEVKNREVIVAIQKRKTSLPALKKIYEILKDDGLI